MRVYLGVKNNATTGKGFFLCRLGKALGRKGIFVTHDPSVRHDISVHPVKIKNKTKSKKIIRLDGIYHNLGQNYKGMNANIKKGLASADALVYQSKYGRAMCERYLGKFNKTTATILNGADPLFYSDVPLLDEKIFLAVSRWRPHKRLRDIIESFLLANIGGSKLYVAGDTKDSGLSKSEIRKYASDPRIKMFGVLDQKKLASFYKSCVASIHLCWFDCCPNSVIEAVCAGSVVISNNVGGTKEIVGPSGGLICKVDKPYNMKPVQLYRPPKINRSLVAEAMHTADARNLHINNDHVNINNIADQYIKLFKKVLK